MKPIEILRATIITKESVNLPGLGTFFKRFVEAKYDKESKQFVPPHFEIYFDINANSNDTNYNQALFANGYKTEEIADIIAKLIDDIKKLSLDEKYEISDVGFFINSNSGIIFKSNNLYSTELNNFGFKTLNLNEVKSIKNEEIKEPVIVINENSAEKISKNTKTKSPRINKSKSVLKFNWMYLVVPLILIAIFSLIYFTNSYKFIKNISFSQKNKKNSKLLVDKDTIKNVINEEFNLDEDIKKIVNSKIKNTANVYLGQQYKKFYIVCNSFENKQNAENYAFQLRQKGYNTEIVNGNKYYRVVIGGYNDVDLLLKEYTHFQQKQGNDIWILINK